MKQTNEEHDELVDRLQANNERWEAHKDAWENGTFDDPFAYKRKEVLWDEHYGISKERKELLYELGWFYDTKHIIYTYEDYLKAVENGAWVRA